MDGDIIIAGFFPLYTLGTGSSNSDASVHEENNLFSFKNYQFVLSLAFAIEEINKNPNLLHNLTLGFNIYDFLYGTWTAFINPFTCLFGNYKIPNYNCMRDNQPIAVLTGTSGAISSQIGTLLGLYRFPQLTSGPFDHVLSDNNMFPGLYQMAPRDTSIASAMVLLLLHFSWNWVGLITLQDENGLWILPALKEEMTKNRVCVAVELTFPNYAISNIFKIMAHYNQINKSSANVVIIYADNEFMHYLMMCIEQILIKGKVFIMNTQWDSTLRKRYFIPGSFHVPLIFSHHRPDVSGFTDFLKSVNPSKYPKDFFLARLWFLSFNCSGSESDIVKWENCPHDASLDWLPKHTFDKTMSRDSYTIYNAVYAVAQALHEMLLHQTETQTMRNRKVMVLSPAQLHSFLKNIQFHNPAGDQVILHEKKKLVAEYDIVNIWNFPEGLHFEMKPPHSVCSESCGPGFRKSPQEEKAACCYDCIPCSENEMANGTDMEQCVKCPGYQYANTERNQCLQRAASFLAYGEPLGMALACMALCLSTLTAFVLGVFVKHRNTPIVKANNQALSYILLISLIFCFLCSLFFIGCPNTVTCILQQTIFGVAFTVAVSAALAKTVTVVLAFKVTSPGRRLRWLLLSGAPNFIIPICTLIQGSLTAFYSVLGYLVLLALASFIVAFLARNLPDSFNEAKFLTFSMLVFCSVWLTFVPVYHSAKGKVMAATEVFSILASSAGLLGCIFVPKCYIILLRPERNFLHGFRDITHHEK
ncbi:vomeronasal type-2 receptor 116-like [Dipodomys spectabilis]|uniref:vomeronasal type-2 receptor 116-like n=1 Tax=Dipodomys spectabilis TaxID=105255 RepID=UPI001C54B82F|nr:vomeronasal type-2 receptor 116-like [Dipodomys spectabilis]